MQFSIAVDRGYKDNSGNKQTDFINCVAWKATAENLAKYQRKGNMVLVEGQIQTRNYTDQSGNKKYITEVVANRIEYLEAKKEETNTYQNTNPFATTNQNIQYHQPGETSPADFMAPNSDDLPF